MTDMKKGLIFVLFALVSIVSYSQISWNAKVGMNMSNFTGDADTDMMFTQKGAKLGDIKANPMYLELPVMAAARFAVVDGQNVVVKAGPYLACGIAGKYKMNGVKEDFFGDNSGGKRFDFGLGVGVAYEINRFFVDLTGEFGLTKVYDASGSPKNINFSIGVGYKF